MEELSFSNNNNNGIEPQHKILCCSCGTPIAPNPANMCIDCVRNQVDISEGIPKQITVNWCKNCERYLQPPNAWITAQTESRELMALLLRKLKTLNKVRLIDASFIWTEPHSRRLKLKLTIQKEVFTSAILQQVFQVEAIVAGMQCPECTRIMAQDSWNAVVQVRQKVAHKRTFFFLEQLILKFNAHKDTINIKERKDGLDFFFASRTHSLQFLNFLQTVVPVKHEHSQQLISTDIRSGTANYKHTYSVEIIPICKDDLLALPLKLARQMGNINPLALCTKISGGTITVVDPRTLQTADIQANVYWRDQFSSLCEAGNSSALSEYYVLDIEHLGQTKGRNALVDVTVAKCIRPSNLVGALTENDLDIDMSRTFITRSHLGNILKEGDYVYGYDLHSTNFNSDLFEEVLRVSQSNAYHELPDVLLLKKIYFKSKKKNRYWKVKRIAEGMESGGGGQGGAVGMDIEDEGRQKRVDKERKEQEWENFLREIEEDKEMRGMMNLYRDKKVPAPAATTSHDIDLSELLEEMDINDNEQQEDHEMNIQ